MSARGLSAASSCLLLLVVGCTLDTTPRLSEAARNSPLSGRVPTRTVDTTPDEETFGPRATPSLPDVPPTIGGLECSGVVCPFAPAPIEPCCTTPQDVARGAARDSGRCGVDFSATSGGFFGNACWQRDQPGVLDDTCEPLTLQPGAQEAGCCTEEGSCGGLNVGQGLGCHYQLDGEPKRCGQDVVTEVVCEGTGIFGIRATVDMSWGGRSGGLVGLTDDGRDQMQVHLRAIVDAVDNKGEMHGTVQPCNVELPPFYSSLLCESYQPIFPVEMWESPTLPVIALSGRYGCLHPGCLLTIDPKTVLLGIDLVNPEAPWPTAQDTPKLLCAGGKGEQCFLDHDNDLLPGTTVKLKTEGMAPPGTACNGDYAYRGAPLSAALTAIFGGVKRADRILLGTRTKLGGSGKLAMDCNSGVGEGVAEFVQSRAWGCFAQPGSGYPGETPAGPNEACEGAEAAFMYENLPIYKLLGLNEKPATMLNVTDRQPSTGPLFSMVRLGKLGDPVSCANVRDAAYP